MPVGLGGRGPGNSWGGGLCGLAKFFTVCHDQRYDIMERDWQNGVSREECVYLMWESGVHTGGVYVCV